MSDVEIHLLGSPRVDVSGVPLVTDTRKATALLAYLAVTGQPASRDGLSDLLWPEVGQKKARAALRRTLSALSEAREDGWLIGGRENVSLDLNRVSTDVARFRYLIAERRAHGHAASEVCVECEKLLSGAVALFRGDFMAGFSLRDSAVFDDWQFFEGENLRQELAVALDGLAKIEAVKSEWESATSHARRRLALDPLNESAHRRLMEIFAWSGRRSAALKQYDECERILADELGVSPLEETIRLYRDIRADEPPPPPSLEEKPGEYAPGAKRPVRDAFFGREVELGAVISAYEAGARVIFISGEAGIGKTRLAEEFLSHIESDGATTISAHCYESERDLAYGPFVEALSSVATDPNLLARLAEIPDRYLEEAARLVPELSGSGIAPPLDTPGARSRFFEGVAQTLSAATSGVLPGVVFVDDVHLADASSLELLAYLSRRLEKIGASSLLLTRRGVQSEPSLGKFREEARRAGGMVEVPVGRLGPETVEEMARAACEASPELSRRLYEETEGVPLFVGEYLRAISVGDLPSEGGAWMPPGGVTDIIIGRLETLGETSRQTLGAAAAVGRSFDFDTVREASGRSEDETLEAIEDLVSRGVISEVRDARDATYDFSHGLLREAVYERTGLARRRILHRRVAEALAKKRDAPAARVAHHQRLAGEDEEAARHFALAGEEARRLYANAEALSHFEAALELGHPDTARLREGIGDLHTLAGNYDAAIEHYGGAAATARVQRKLGGVYQRLGDWQPAEACYFRAMDLLGDDAASSENAMLHADLGLLAHSRGDHIEAARYAEESLRLAGETKNPLTLARTHSIAAMVSRGTGDIEQARRNLEKSLAYSGDVEDKSVRIAALNNLALVLGEAGEEDAAIATAEQALGLCRKLGDRHREAAIGNNLADLCHAAGQEEDSREHLKRAVEVFAEIGGEDLLRPGIWRLVEW